MKKFSIIIPCNNEEKNIRPIYELIDNVFKNEKYQLELIFVNDGSTDKTLANIKKLLAKKKHCIKIIDLSRRFGKDAAVYAGLQSATGQYIGIIDADLQQHPMYLLKMVNILEHNYSYDCVSAYPKKRIDKKVKNILSSIFYNIINISSDIKLQKNASDFRVFRRKVAKALLNLPEVNRFSKGMFAWVGFNNCYIEYEVAKRKNGKSKFNAMKLFKYAKSRNIFTLKITTKYN